MLKRKLALAYILLVRLPLFTLWGDLEAGKNLTPHVSNGTAGPNVVQSPAPLDLFTLVLQIGVILLVSRFTGMLFKKLGQPQVDGDMAAGILLGPSVLGWAAPALSQTLFPVASLGYLTRQGLPPLISFQDMEVRSQESGVRMAAAYAFSIRLTSPGCC
jgi:hypothetical protein